MQCFHKILFSNIHLHSVITVSNFKALEKKLIGGVTLNHLCWASLGRGEVLTKTT